MIGGSFDDCDKRLPRLVLRKEKKKKSSSGSCSSLSLSLSLCLSVSLSSLSLSVSKFVWFGVFTLMVADYTVSAHTWITDWHRSQKVWTGCGSLDCTFRWLTVALDIFFFCGLCTFGHLLWFLSCMAHTGACYFDTFCHFLTHMKCEPL